MNNPTRFAAFSLCVALSLGATAQSVSPPQERLLNKADIEAAIPFEGVYSKRLYTDTVYITMVTMEAGKSSRLHNHPDEQTMLFHTGSARAYVGENEYVVGPDDILIIPAYVPHYIEAIEDSTWTEVHGPGFNNGPRWESQ